jgi:hypothetical protein
MTNTTKIRTKIEHEIEIEDFDDGSRKLIHPSGKVVFENKAQRDAYRAELIADRDMIQSQIDLYDVDQSDIERIKNG